jgi:hypothetical protein
MHIYDGPIPLAAPPIYSGRPENAPAFKMPGYGTVFIPADTLDVKMVLLNPEGNQHYLAFEIILEETGEALHASGKIAPGASKESIMLNRPLPKGEHNAGMIIRAYGAEGLIKTNTANVTLIMVAE